MRRAGRHHAGRHHAAITGQPSAEGKPKVNGALSADRLIADRQCAEAFVGTASAWVTSTPMSFLQPPLAHRRSASWRSALGAIRSSALPPFCPCPSFHRMKRDVTYRTNSVPSWHRCARIIWNCPEALPPIRTPQSRWLCVGRTPRVAQNTKAPGPRICYRSKGKSYIQRGLSRRATDGPCVALPRANTEPPPGRWDIERNTTYLWRYQCRTAAVSP